MAEFAYDNAKHASTGYIPFKLNFGYHPHVSYKNDVNFYSSSKAVDELTEELRNLMAACRENLQYAQQLQKQDIIKELCLEITLSVRRFD